MEAPPNVLASSVIRSVDKGDSHGGLYITDLRTNSIDQVLDWDTADIDWAGRGGDRGLRGIAIRDGVVFVAASDELFVFDQTFQRMDSFRNRYLKHCHEITVAGNYLLLCSTGFDSILAFDISDARFVRGYLFRFSPREEENPAAIVPRCVPFDPHSSDGPEHGDTLHLNSVDVDENGSYISGTGLPAVIRLADERATVAARIPKGTHNVLRQGDGFIFNDTRNDRIAFIDHQGDIKRTWSIPTYDPRSLHHTDVPDDHARQGFGRGLLTYNGWIIGGSSPATISVYDRRVGGNDMLRIQLSRDIRNAIHGLEIWPY